MKKQTYIFSYFFHCNTFVWLSVRNLAFLPVGKRLRQAGSSTWIVAATPLLSRFLFFILDKYILVISDKYIIVM